MCSHDLRTRVRPNVHIYHYENTFSIWIAKVSAELCRLELISIHNTSLYSLELIGLSNERLRVRSDSTFHCFVICNIVS